jgi:hypothetical protein
MCCVAVSFVLSGCAEVQLEILSNGGRDPIQVRYGIPKYRSEASQPPTCPGRPEDPQVGPTPANPKSEATWTVNDWHAPARFTWDPEKCEMALTLDPGFSVLIARVGFCAGDERRIDPRTTRSNLEYLMIESAGRVIEWRGWDTARQFKRISRSICVYRFA